MIEKDCLPPYKAECILPEYVNIPNPLYKSIKGKYFAGQTENLSLGKGFNAWGGLFNPCKSNIDLFVNVLTVSNYSSMPFTAEIWFNSNPPGTPATSSKISPANTALRPITLPKVKLKYEKAVCGNPTGGVNVFSRIVPPNSTLASEEDGKFIFPSGGSYVIFLKSPSTDNVVKAKIAFGWWEEQHC